MTQNKFKPTHKLDGCMPVRLEQERESVHVFLEGHIRPLIPVRIERDCKKIIRMQLALPGQAAVWFNCVPLDRSPPR